MQINVWREARTLTGGYHINLLTKTLNLFLFPVSMLSKPQHFHPLTFNWGLSTALKLRKFLFIPPNLIT